MYSQFHKTLPNSGKEMHWISVRFYEMGDIYAGEFFFIPFLQKFIFEFLTFSLIISPINLELHCKEPLQNIFAFLDMIKSCFAVAHVAKTPQTD